MTQVTLTDVVKIYRGREEFVAVDHVDLEIPSNKITALLGPSGCGKTTTLKMIAGLIDPTGGDILFDGKSVKDVPAHKRGAVMVFQNHLLFPYMSVGDNVGFGLRMQHVDKKTRMEKVREILELVHLPGLEDRKPKQLSGGQSQRAALARALVVGPKVLLLDEPLSNLDAHLRDEMRELIISIQHQLEITTIFVTHDQEEAVILADTIGLMFGGTIQQFDQPNSFYECPVSKRVAKFFGALNFIDGIKEGDRFLSDQLNLELGECDIQDGPVSLTIRPENLILETRGTNTVTANIRSHVYVGTHTRYKVQVGEIELVVIGDALSIRRYQDGDTVPLHIPKDKVWLIPRE